jgi:hypothetical protein
MIDIVREIGATQREVGTGQLAAGEGRAVRLRRTYDAPIEDVWDALTDPQRIGRWFLPISGDYRLGGRFCEMEPNDWRPATSRPGELHCVLVGAVLALLQ